MIGGPLLMLNGIINLCLCLSTGLTSTFGVIAAVICGVSVAFGLFVLVVGTPVYNRPTLRERSRSNCRRRRTVALSPAMHS